MSNDDLPQTEFKKVEDVQVGDAIYSGIESGILRVEKIELAGAGSSYDLELRTFDGQLVKEKRACGEWLNVVKPSGKVTRREHT